MHEQAKQRGGSIIGLIIGLAILGTGTYIGLQYIPLVVESSAVGSILNSLVTSNRANPFSSVGAVENALEKQLEVNEMYDLKDNFIVIQGYDSFTVTANYERELNLIYTVRKLQYEKSVTLK